MQKPLSAMEFPIVFLNQAVGLPLSICQEQCCKAAGSTLQGYVPQGQHCLNICIPVPACDLLIQLYFGRTGELIEGAKLYTWYGATKPQSELVGMPYGCTAKAQSKLVLTLHQTSASGESGLSE